MAKISRPASSGAYVREDVFLRMDRKLRGPILWITAPAGSGKTTLASSYLETRRLSHLWLQLDETDADPAAFFHFLRPEPDGAPKALCATAGDWEDRMHDLG